MRIGLLGGLFLSILFCSALSVQAQDRSRFLPNDPMVQALQNRKVYVDPELENIDTFSLRKMTAQAFVERPLSILVTKTIPANGRPYRTLYDYTKALHDYLGLGKGRLIVLSGQDASAATAVLSSEEITQVLDQTKETLKNDPMQGIRQTVKALDERINIKDPLPPPILRPAPGSQAGVGGVRFPTLQPPVASASSSTPAPPLMAIAIPLVLLGAGVVLWVGKGVVAQKKTLEETQAEVQKRQGEVRESLAYVDTYLDLLPFSVDATAAQESRQAAASLLEQAAGSAGRARTSGDYRHVQMQLEQAGEQAEQACHHIEMATGGTEFAIALEGTEYKATPVQRNGHLNSLPAPIPVDFSAQDIPLAERSACYFCSRPSRLSDLTPVLIAVKGYRCSVLACAEEVHTVQQGAAPSVRTVFSEGQRVPWYRATDYDPYSDFGDTNLYPLPTSAENHGILGGLWLDVPVPDLVPMPYPVYVSSTGKITCEPDFSGDNPGSREV